jgi:hypothetical protein
MNAFTIRWRSPRQHREIELAAPEDVAVPLMAALQASDGLAVWQSGTLWKCPGCGDRTVKTEEFLEGMHRAEGCLQRWASEGTAENSPERNPAPALAWLSEMAARLLGCERDRVYINDESGGCSYQGSSYTSRI